MVTMRYYSFPAQFLPNFDHEGGMSYSSEVQDSATLHEVQATLHDDSIKCVALTTYTGDLWDNLYIGYSTDNTQWKRVKMIPDWFGYLDAVLPHGSGIDLEWDMTHKGQYVYAHNSYHAMDCMGGYTGWIDFTVKLYAYKNGSLEHNFRVVSVTCPNDRTFIQYDEEGQEYDDLPAIRDYLADTMGAYL